MNRYLTTLHPTEDFELIIAYDADSLRIEHIWDDNKQDIELNPDELACIKKEIIADDKLA